MNLTSPDRNTKQKKEVRAVSLPRDKDQPRKRIRSPKKPDLAVRMARFAASHRLWKKGERILVAVSGGADSVALLHLLYLLKKGEDLRLTVVHLDHGLRGQASEADSRWVRELAGRLDIPCLVERRVVSAKLRRGGRSPVVRGPVRCWPMQGLRRWLLLS